MSAASDRRKRPGAAACARRIVELFSARAQLADSRMSIFDGVDPFENTLRRRDLEP
jgi:hypothetical protein